MLKYNHKSYCSNQTQSEGCTLSHVTMECCNHATIHLNTTNSSKGFPGSSAGKESACNAGDPGSNTGLGKSTGEGIGYPLQYS